MKKILGLLSTAVLAGNLMSYAQINLEHEYAGKTMVGRILMDNNIGVKYHYLNRPEKQFELYNEDHTLWKTIDLSATNMTANTSVHVASLAAKELNNDDKIELLVRIMDFQSDVSTIYIINEDGEVQASKMLTGSIASIRGRINDSTGQLDKLVIEYGYEIASWANSSLIIDAQSLVTEAAIPNGNIRLLKTDAGEQKIVAVNNSLDELVVYSTEGDEEMTIPLPDSDIDYMLGSIVLTKHFHNTDDNYELLIGHLDASNTANPNTGYMLDENGTILNNYNDYQFYLEMNLDNEPVRVVSYGLGHTNVYEPIMDTPSHTYMAGAFRYRYQGDGEFMTTEIDTENHTVRLYHEDGSLWNETTLNVPEGYKLGSVRASTQFYNTDDLFEFTYNYYHNSNGSKGVIVENENGEQLIDIPGADTGSEHRLPGQANKMIVTQLNDGYTRVYDLTTSTPGLSVANEPEEDPDGWGVYPNSQPGEFFLSLPPGIDEGEIGILDMEGQLRMMTTVQGPETLLQLSELPKGIYIIKWLGQEKLKNLKIVKI